VRVFAHIKKLDDCFGQFLARFEHVRLRLGVTFYEPATSADARPALRGRMGFAVCTICRCACSLTSREWKIDSDNSWCA
jgi:hypothetical protein